MEMEKTLRELVGDTSFLDTLYGWVYNRAYNRDEVDDIVHDIVIALLAASQYHDTDYTYAYVWKTAENVHANHERKKYRSSRNVCELDEFCVNTSVSLHDDSFEEKLIGKIVDTEMYDRIMRETAFLSRIYRDVMVMFYFHELPVSEIAKRLDIPENRVKQRLFSAREKIKNNLSGKETNTMTTSTMIQPYRMSFCGSGNPMETDVYKGFSSSMFEQNIAIACRDKAKTPSEIASETGIPTAYVENALNNMSDEIIKRCGDDKYIANILIVDAKVRKEANAIMEKVASEYVGDVLDNWIYAHGNDKKILETLDKSGVQHTLEYILWSVVPRIADPFEIEIVNDVIKSFDKPEKDVREYYVLATYSKPDDRNESDALYGWNGEGWGDGWKEPYRFSNFTDGKRFSQSVNRFYAAYQPLPELMMVYKAIGGLAADSIPDEDKAAVSRAEELGYIKKDGGKYYPNMLIIKDEDIAAIASAQQVFDIADKYTHRCSDELRKLAEKYVSKHMYMHMSVFLGEITSIFRHFVIEEAIKRGALYQPEPTGTEGMWCTISE